MGKEGWRVIAIVNTLAAKTLTNMTLWLIDVTVWSQYNIVKQLPSN